MELSVVPVRFLLIGRRLNFYWNILQKDEEELVRKVFNTQKLFPVKNDFICQIESDLEYCNIEQTEEEISKMKKSTFQNIVDEKIREVCSQYLLSLKNSHSKSVNLKYSNEMQPYLRNEQLSIQEKKLMFRIKN